MTLSTILRKKVLSTLDDGFQNWNANMSSMMTDAAHSPFVLIPGGRIAHRAAQAFGDQCVGIGDSDKTKWGSRIEGLLVQPVEEVVRNNPGATVVVCSAMYGYAIETHLRSIGDNDIIPYPVATLVWPDVFSNREYLGLGEAIFESDSYSKIAELSNCLSDEHSRVVLWGKLLFYLNRARNNLTNICSSQLPYFCNDVVVPTSGFEKFVDVGAFTGDTLQDWKKFGPKEFSYYLALEPDESAFARLREEAGNDARIYCAKLGLSDKNERAFFSQHGTVDSELVRQEKVVGGGVSIETVCLDDFLKDYELPSQVKMDIEGSERRAIEGARKTFSNRNVRLSVSAYHFPKDLWEIPLLLKEIRPESRIFLRHYTNEIDDTVCYVLK